MFLMMAWWRWVTSASTTGSSELVANGAIAPHWKTASRASRHL